MVLTKTFCAQKEQELAEVKKQVDMILNEHRNRYILHIFQNNILVLLLSSICSEIKYYNVF
jgi:hypothetical protein